MGPFAIVTLQLGCYFHRVSCHSRAAPSKSGASQEMKGLIGETVRTLEWFAAWLLLVTLLGIG
jgi:hypothetical protein